MSEKVCVFMDESGKDKKSLSIIGAIAIPQNYYESEKIQALNKRLRAKEFRLHFTNYNHGDFEAYSEVVKAMTNCISPQVQLNMIVFKRGQYAKHALFADKDPNDDKRNREK